METKIYNQLPDEAKEIRLEVFVKEQTAVTPSESAAFSQTPGAAGS